MNKDNVVADCSSNNNNVDNNNVSEMFILQKKNSVHFEKQRLRRHLTRREQQIISLKYLAAAK